MQYANEPTLVVVLGMHRSGTSAVTRALNIFDIALGDNLLPAVENDNTTGYWEDRDINAINIRCLDRLGMDWDDLHSISPNAFNTHEFDELASYAESLLREKLAANNQAFGLKDPRICRLLGFWKPIFERIAVAPRYVICIRNPLSVADSLQRRGTTEPEKAHLLWLRHVRASIHETLGATRVVIDYDRLIDQPETEVRRLGERLGLSSRLDSDRLREYCDSFLDAKLRHNQRYLPDVIEQESVILSEVIDLYRFALDFATDTKDIDAPESQARWAIIYNRFASFSRSLNFIIGELRLQRDEARAQLVQLRQETSLVLADRDLAIEQRNQLLNSNSWRLTAPLRIMSTLLTRSARMPYYLRQATAIAGGAKRLPWLALRVLHKEGIQGIRERLDLLQAMNADNASAANVPFLPESAPTKRRSQSPPAHSVPVDIIVCVHNALDDVSGCLTALIAKTVPPYRIIIVDDGSNRQTQAFIDDFIIGQPVRLIRHAQALGYTLAANAGMQASTADFVVLLNSDTIVTDGWLDRMIACANDANDIGLVGPLSNTASWQSVPKIFDDQGDWAENSLPPGYDVDRMGALVASASARCYPRVGFLNGFCLLIKRAVIEQIGPFDEATFGAGFGEENDYCLRSVAAGWQLAVADDTYVYHAQSRSYSHERRSILVQQADRNLRSKHANAVIMRQLMQTRDHLGLAAIRATVANAPARAEMRARLKERHEGQRVLFVLPIASPGGGANVVITEAETLMQCGVIVEILNLCHFQSFFEAGYPDLAVPVRYVYSGELIAEIARDYDVIVGTVYSSIAWLSRISENTATAPVLGYYAQDFEPYFFQPTDPRRQQALDSYSLPGLRVFTKTDWTRALIKQETGVEPVRIGPSLETRDWYPASQGRPSTPVTVAAMVRPSTPRRAPERTVAMLQALVRERGEAIRILVFGLDTADTRLLGSLAEATNCQIHGVLGREAMRALLASSHLFLDLSDFQAMGLTCMEAMACGAAVVGPMVGGLSEIVRHEHSGILVDTHNEQACLTAILDLVDHPDKRATLAANALVDIAAYYPESAALRIMDYLLPQP